MLNTETIISLANCGFAMDLPEVVLTQRQTATPQVRRGRGTVSQDESGWLRLKLHLNHELGEADAFMNALVGVAGKLLEDAAFFRMEAKDSGGNVWICERLRVRDHSEDDAKHGVVTARLRSIETAQACTCDYQGSTCDLVVTREFDLPFDDWLETGNRKSLHVFNGVLPRGASFKLTRLDGYTRITVNGDAIEEKTITHLVEGLSIVTGHDLQVVYRSTVSNQLEKRRISSFSKKYDEQKLWTVLGESDRASVVEFIHNYVGLSTEPKTFAYFTFWQMVWSAWHFGMATVALPLAVYIEGVVKEFFPELLSVDEKTKGSVDEIIKNLAESEGIKSLGIPRELVQRACGLVSNMKNNSTRGALRKLVTAGWFNGDLVVKWAEIRNKTAHGADLISLQEYEQLQGVSDAILASLQLFYLLLFIKIRYSGSFTDLSQQGFPRTRLAPLQSRANQ